MTVMDYAFTRVAGSGLLRLLTLGRGSCAPVDS
jgi:hypothetical protein